MSLRNFIPRLVVFRLLGVHIKGGIRGILEKLSRILGKRVCRSSKELELQWLLLDRDERQILHWQPQAGLIIFRKPQTLEARVESLETHSKIKKLDTPEMTRSEHL